MELREYNRIKQQEFRVGKKMLHVLLQNTDFNRLDEIVARNKTTKKDFYIKKIKEYYDLVKNMTPDEKEAMGAEFAQNWFSVEGLERSDRPISILVSEEDREKLGYITKELDITIKEFIVNMIYQEI